MLEAKILGLRKGERLVITVSEDGYITSIKRGNGEANAAIVIIAEHSLQYNPVLNCWQLDPDALLLRAGCVVKLVAQALVSKVD